MAGRRRMLRARGRHTARERQHGVCCERCMRPSSDECRIQHDGEAARRGTGCTCTCTGSGGIAGSCPSWEAPATRHRQVANCAGRGYVCWTVCETVSARLPARLSVGLCLLDPSARPCLRDRLAPKASRACRAASAWASASQSRDKPRRAARARVTHSPSRASASLAPREQDTRPIRSRAPVQMAGSDRFRMYDKARRRRRLESLPPHWLTVRTVRESPAPPRPRAAVRGRPVLGRVGGGPVRPIRIRTVYPQP